MKREKKKKKKSFLNYPSCISDSCLNILQIGRANKRVTNHSFVISAIAFKLHQAPEQMSKENDEKLHDLLARRYNMLHQMEMVINMTTSVRMICCLFDFGELWGGASVTGFGNLEVSVLLNITYS